MNILLDTHVFIWSTANPEKLSQKVRDLLYSKRLKAELF